MNYQGAHFKIYQGMREGISGGDAITLIIKDAHFRIWEGMWEGMQEGML